jgi:glycyl-tRNA synthetase beta chain
MNTNNFLTDDLLIELGCEELPPKSLLILSTAFKDLLDKQLTQQQIRFTNIHAFATPRRLALLITELAAQQPDQTLQKRGPALTAAFNAIGEPTPAALGFAKSCGVSMDALGKLETDKGAWLIYDAHQKGQSTLTLLPQLITNALQQLPIAKRMRWGIRTDSFIRPVKWLLALYGDAVVDMTLFDCKSDRITYGHRVHAPQAISIQHPKNYADTLKNQGFVIADFSRRRRVIENELQNRAKALQAQLSTSDSIDALINEVTALVEWPSILAGQFESHFLQVPKEALIQTMQDNQKYFALFDDDKNLISQFLFVSNLQTDDASKIIQGNEKVIRPRFSDAEFFFKQDQQQPLEHYNQALKALVFQNKLGSVYDKVLRVQALSGEIARTLNIDIAKTQRAALLCKADLATQMVQEMPELQGIMGSYYAQSSGEDASIALAIREHYLPLQTNDLIPQSPVGICVALADKIDSLVGIFAAGLIPTGDKDPFALRRAALGIIRIIIHNKCHVSLVPLLKKAAESIQVKIPTIDCNLLSEKVWQFIHARLEHFYQSSNIDVRILQAVSALNISDVYDLHLRINSIHVNAYSSNFQALSSANKRVNNLLKKLSLDALAVINPQFFEIDAEKNLYQALIEIKPLLDHTLQIQDYSEAIKQLSQLRQPVDTFFEQVHIMSDDKNLQNNRLALLKLLQSEFLKIADLSYLVIEA